MITFILGLIIGLIIGFVCAVTMLSIVAINKTEDTVNKNK